MLTAFTGSYSIVVCPSIASIWRLLDSSVDERDVFSRFLKTSKDSAAGIELGRSVQQEGMHIYIYIYAVLL